MKGRFVSPAATGYGKHLYSAMELPKGKQALIETAFMSLLDDKATKALNIVRDPGSHGIPIPLRHAAARFVVSLLLRTPEEIERIKRHYLEKWLEGDPAAEETYARNRKEGDAPTLREFLEGVDPAFREFHALILAAELIGNRLVGDFISNAMTWSALYIPEDHCELMTSNRPVVMTNGLKVAGGYIVLPVGPRALLTMTYDDEARRILQGTTTDQLVEDVNRTVGRHAMKFVYATSGERKAFVEEHMEKEDAPSLLKAMGMTG